MVSCSSFIRITNSSDNKTIWTANRENHPLATGICDPNKSRAKHHSSLNLTRSWGISTFLTCFTVSEHLKSYLFFQRNVQFQNIHSPYNKIRYIFLKNSIKMYTQNFSEEIIPTASVKWNLRALKESSCFPFFSFQSHWSV